MLKKLITALAATLSLGVQAGIDVKVVGQGRPVLMIPGLASGSEVWTDTCAALAVECHMVQLPGFAGAKPVPTETFLETQRDALRAYLSAKGLKQVDVIGHSLGGNLALMLAAAEPEKVRRAVLVDSLPFLAGMMNPAATAEAAQQMANGMKAQMKAAPKEQVQAQQAQMAKTMTRSAEGQATILRWGQASDGDTVIQAMTELWGGDFRPLLPRLQQPLLVLGAWAAYKPMGSTLEGTQGIFDRQYATAKDVRVRMSQEGFHFLMWDDRDWLVNEVKAFLQ